MKKSKNYNEDNIPDVIKKDPILLLLFLIVYPFRTSPDVVKWLDDQLNQ